MKFDGFSARLVLSGASYRGRDAGVGAGGGERRWGLFFALACLLEVVASNLIFMTVYMDDITRMACACS